VGAKEKRERAIEQTSGSSAKGIRSSRGGGKESFVIYLLLIYGMAVITVLLLMRGSFLHSAPFYLENPLLQHWLLEMPPPLLMNDRAASLLIAAFLRGGAFFLAAGVLPLLTFLLYRISGTYHKHTPPSLTLFWLVIVLIFTAASILLRL
jgi:hypothetical protein